MAGRRIRADRGRRLPPRLQPGTDRPGEQQLDAGQYPENRLGDRCRFARRGPGLLPRHRRVDRGGVLAARGRAGQDHREHLPAREHRLGERTRHIRAWPRHRRVGGHRRRFDQAVRVHAVHPWARSGRPLPADRPLLPVLAGRAGARPELPLRGTGQRHQRPHAGLRRPPAHDGVQHTPPSHQWSAHPAIGAGLQEEHRRCAGVTGRPRRTTAEEHGGGRTGG